LRGTTLASGPAGPRGGLPDAPGIRAHRPPLWCRTMPFSRAPRPRT
jgi:hypothetical protein